MSVSDLLWTLAFLLIVVLAVLGNLTVLWIVLGAVAFGMEKDIFSRNDLLGKKKMQSPTNSFLVNISVADIGMALFNCLPSFLFMRDNEWLFGAVGCSICQFR